MLEVDDETFEQLKVLFPHEPEDPTVNSQVQKGKNPLQRPATKEYIQFARKASRVAAPGPSGLRLGVITLPFRCKPRKKAVYQCQKPLQNLMDEILQADPVTVPIVKNARLVAVPKPNGKARPICMANLSAGLRWARSAQK